MDDIYDALFITHVAF